MSRRTLILLVLIAALIAGGVAAVRAALRDAFLPHPNNGPIAADGNCPKFEARYPRCEVLYGNRGLSTLGSIYETFVGEGPFEIRSFEVSAPVSGPLAIVAESNRGPLRSEIFPDRIVRLGQEREDEKTNLTHQSAYCDRGRIFEHQVGYAGGQVYVQDLEFWRESDTLRFRLFQNGRATADVSCQTP